MQWIQKVALCTLIVYLLLRSAGALSIIQIFAMILMPSKYEMSIIPFATFYVAFCLERYTVYLLHRHGINDVLDKIEKE